MCDYVAGVAQLVEHHLAKVDVEGSNPFARSIFTDFPAVDLIRLFYRQLHGCNPNILFCAPLTLHL